LGQRLFSIFATNLAENILDNFQMEFKPDKFIKIYQANQGNLGTSRRSPEWRCEKSWLATSEKQVIFVLLIARD
jgi:hypothetical protein